MAIDFFFDADQEVLGKIMYNRYAVGMAVFCLGILFNSVSMLLILTGGLIRCSTGIYLFLIAFSDTCVLVFGALMDEFYFDLINVDVFYDSDDPKALCQAVYFLRELFYYYRWFLLATMVVDGCLVISGRVGARNLAFFAVVFSVAWLLVSGGLAGYWIHFVGEILIGERQFTSGMCEITSPLPGDHESTWFYMDTIGMTPGPWSRSIDPLTLFGSEFHPFWWHCLSLKPDPRVCRKIAEFLDGNGSWCPGQRDTALW